MHIYILFLDSPVRYMTIRYVLSVICLTIPHDKMSHDVCKTDEYTRMKSGRGGRERNGYLPRTVLVVGRHCVIGPEAVGFLFRPRVARLFIYPFYWVSLVRPINYYDTDDTRHGRGERNKTRTSQPPPPPTAAAAETDNEIIKMKKNRVQY